MFLSEVSLSLSLADTAHGGALDLSIAQAAIAAGFPPDTISSDYHSHELAHRLDGEVGILHSPDLPSTMAMMNAAGMSRLEVLCAVTAAPAAAVRSASPMNIRVNFWQRYCVVSRSAT